MAPAAIMSFAPCAVSSAGWKASFTVPQSSSLTSLRMWAAVIMHAVWPSWPQACMRPSTLDLKGRSFSSATGRASMSPRMRMVLPGFAP